LPLLLAREGHKWSEFVSLFRSNSVISTNLFTSGLYFYLYNELATLTIKKTNAVTQSVANTAKRVIVIVGRVPRSRRFQPRPGRPPLLDPARSLRTGVALVLGESLAPIKLLGCAIGIGGVLLYSLIDKIVYG